MIDTDTAILASATVTLASTTAASVLPDKYGGKGELPRPRLIVGTVLTFAGLSIVGAVAPAVARGLAAAVAVTALTYYGLPIADNYFNGHHNPVGKPTDIPSPPEV